MGDPIDEEIARRKRRTATLRLTPLGASGSQVQIGDQDITTAVRSLVLRADVGEVHRLELDLRIFEVEAEVDGTRTVVPDKTRAALVALGWAPPVNDD